MAKYLTHSIGGIPTSPDGDNKAVRYFNVASQQNVTSMTQTDITALTIPVEANKHYEVRISINTGCNGTSGFRIGLKIPASAEVMEAVIGRTTGETAFAAQATLRTTTPTTVDLDYNAQNAQSGFVEIFYHVVTGGTAGDIIPTFASNVGTETSSINKYSLARVEEFIPQP